MAKGKNQVDQTYKIFYILIPVGAILLAVVCNWFYDNYHEKVLKRDSREILDYLMTRDIDTAEEYKEVAIEMFKEKGYDDADLISIYVGDDYLLFAKYHTFKDLRVFFNIFDIHWFDDHGMVNDEDINSKLDRKSAMVAAKYLVHINEWKEAVIDDFSGDENDFFLTEEAKKANQEEKKD
jgi:hypothetical protein